MPRARTVRKRQRQTEVRRVRNKSVRSELKTLERKVKSSAEVAPQDLNALKSGLDKAASKGVIHKNKAARKKSRLTKQSSTQTS
jgi:small subunit ribosomal protein S20